MMPDSGPGQSCIPYATVQVSKKCHFVLTLAAKQLTGEARVEFVQAFQFGDFHRQDTTLFDLSPRGFDREKVIHPGTCVGSSRVRHIYVKRRRPCYTLMGCDITQLPLATVWFMLILS